MSLKIKGAAEKAPPADLPEDKKGKKKPSGLVHSGTLAQVLAAIRKDKGDKVVIQGDEILTVRRLPTGIFEFDFHIGGGFPCGRYSIVYGPESSNKTNVCLKAVAMAQRLPPPRNKAVWVNIEQSFDPVWAQKMGVNVSELLVVQPGYGEEAIDLVDALVRADDVGILVVDSMAGLIANKEIAQSVENYDIGTSALLIKRMVNKLVIALGEGQKRGHDPCVILINQTRFKPGVVFGDPETMPGGEAQKFLSSLRVRLAASNVTDKDLNAVTLKDTRVVVKKAKIPVRAASFNFSFCVHAHGELEIGETSSFNMVKNHLQALSILTKEKDGWKLELVAASKPLMQQSVSVTFPTLGAISDKYYSDKFFQTQLQGLVLEQYAGALVLVAEPDGSPKDVPPGDVQSVAEEG